MEQHGVSQSSSAALPLPPIATSPSDPSPHPHSQNSSPSTENRLSDQPLLQEPIASPNTARLPSDHGHDHVNFNNQMTEVDWIVPVERASGGDGGGGGDAQAAAAVAARRRKTVGERLLPTLKTAEQERDKYAMKARMTGYTLNVAIGLQVLLGALTTGLAVVTTGRQTSIMTSILGGLSTLVASYLARARGSNEPELSIARVKDLEQFIRECNAFEMDLGHCETGEYDQQLNRFRKRFEELLGTANGERRLAPPP